MKNLGSSNIRLVQGGFLGSTSESRLLDSHKPDALTYLPDALILANAEARVTYLNPAAEQMLGLPLHLAHGHVLDEVLTLLDRVTQRPIRVLNIPSQHARFDGAFHLLVRSGGGSIPVQYSVAPTPDESGMTGGYIITLRDVSGLQEYIDKLEAQSMHDEHTRLLRRAELVKRLWRVLQEADPGEPQAFMYLDLNDFKSVNDQAGHAAGDLAIQQIATRLKNVVRDRDTLARLGGDEFGLLLEHCPVERARQRAVQLHQAVESYVLRWNGESFRVGISIGLATFKPRNHSLNSILAAADAACYQAKRDADSTHHIREVALD
jgi:diguanylate cyclase (GGDEF)-like protein/PAS domain S-box-containing protein